MTNPLPPTFRNEKHFTQSVRKAAEQLGWMCYHTGHVPAKEFRNTTTPGFPDLVFCNGQTIFFAELKMPKGRLTQHQKRWIAILFDSGQEVYTWQPADWDFILDRLAQRSAPK